jgi:hypothetical protein
MTSKSQRLLSPRALVLGRALTHLATRTGQSHLQEIGRQLTAKAWGEQIPTGWNEDAGQVEPQSEKQSDFRPESEATSK